MVNLSKLVDYFWNMIPGKSYKCKYPGHDNHYQDEVRILRVPIGSSRTMWSLVSQWLLHGHIIAEYYPVDGVVQVSDCGYPTNLTYARLNAIFWDKDFSFSRMYLDHGWYVYGFMHDCAKDVYYLMPSGGKLVINLATREVRKEGGGLPHLAIPGEYFLEFEKMARYLGRKYGLSLGQIICGDIPQEVEGRLKRKTREKIGFIRLLAAVNGDGSGDR